MLRVQFVVINGGKPRPYIQGCPTHSPHEFVTKHHRQIGGSDLI
jgi:hypothetical protein